MEVIYIYICIYIYIYVYLSYLLIGMEYEKHKNKDDPFFMKGPQIRDLDAPLPPPGFKSRSASFVFHQKSIICLKNNQKSTKSFLKLK